MLICNRLSFQKPITGSLLLPVFNGAKYLRETLDSLASAIDSSTELVIIDDGSNDDSWALISSFAKCNQHICIHAISRANMGLVETLAELVQKSAGEILFRIDCDDKIYPRRLEEQRYFLANHPDVVLVGSDATLIDPIGRLICETNLPSAHDDILNGLLMIPGFNPVPLFHPAVAMRKSAVLEVGNYDTSLEACEDRDLFLRLSRIGRLANIKRCLISYRLHLASFSHTKTALQEKCRRRVIANARKIAGLDFTGATHLFVGKEHLERPVDIYIGWAKRAARAGNVQTSLAYVLKILFSKELNLALLKALVRGPVREIVCHVSSTLFICRWRRLSR